MTANGSDDQHPPWQVLDRRVIYHSAWVGLEHWTVRLPDGGLIPDHHVVIYPRPAVGIVPRDAAGRFLLIDHYRFITGTRGWEIPAGQVETPESVEAAAARELLEETGHGAGRWTRLGDYHPSNGSSNQRFYVMLAEDLTQVAPVSDTNEVLAWRWFEEQDVRRMVRRNEIPDGFSLTALCWALLA
jgi:8-oxo-dGTP pyrophosphatase MutT (NUDIX family)